MHGGVIDWSRLGVLDRARLFPVDAPRFVPVIEPALNEDNGDRGNANKHTGQGSGLNP